MPLVLLHGLGRTERSMLYLARRLKRVGFKPYLFRYHSTKANLEDHVQRFGKFLSENRIGGKPFVAVCHSLGSIVLRNAIADDVAGATSCERAVLLGPPNQGAESARIAQRFPLFRWYYGPILKQLAELKADRGFGKTEVATIAGGMNLQLGFLPILGGDNDGLVRVEETKHPEIENWKRVFVLHPLLMFSPKVASEVERFLLEGKLEDSKSKP